MLAYDDKRTWAALLLECLPSAKQDDKALSFFLAVAQKWRLFWMLNIVSISFALALAGIVYVGDATAITDVNEEAADEESLAPGDGDRATSPLYTLQLPRPWFVFAMNPAVGIVFSFVTSRLLLALCEARPKRGEPGHDTWFWKYLLRKICAAVKAVKAEPCFYAVLCVWLGVSCIAWAAVIPVVTFRLLLS